MNSDSTRTSIAAAVLLGFAAFIVFMVRNISVEQSEWDRLVYIYTGVEAIVFGAAGLLFGTQIQRAATNAAVSRAEAVEERAEKATELSIALRALAQAIEGEQQTQPRSPYEEREYPPRSPR